MKFYSTNALQMVWTEKRLRHPSGYSLSAYPPPTPEIFYPFQLANA
jgi:hypothetical protein